MKELFSVFGENGNVLKLTNEQMKYCKEIIIKIEEENNSVGKKILIMYLLSYIKNFSTENIAAHKKTPKYIIDALTYIDKHYNEKIVAQELAQKLFVCRTTLMTEFKKYTGSTLNDYIIHCRLKNAVSMLYKETPEQQIAEKCGFGDVSNFIRCFKRVYGITPKKYLKEYNIEENL